MLSRTEAFAAAPLFADLPREKIEELAKGALVLHLEAGDKLFSEGQAGTSVGVVQDGEVEVQFEAHGRTLILALARPGTSVGELSLLDEGPRSATVVATMPTEVLSLPRADLLKLLREDPEYMAAVLRLLAGMIRKTNGRLADLAMLDRPTRMARALVDLAEHDGVEVLVGIPGYEKKGILINRDVTESEFAALTALHGQEVQNVLMNMQLNGIIQKDGNSITILDMERLRQAAEVVS